MPKGSGRKRAPEEYEDDGFVVADENAPTLKKAKKEKASGRQLDDEGNEYWEISAQRRVTVSEFKGKSLVSIREYYEKDGKQLPGKKGISLTMEQYATLMSILPDVEAALAKKGETVPRPNFEGNAGGPVKESATSDDEEGAESGRQNFEATSDED